jgi:drug/metabolite transporter (DMT)-like permease
MTKVRSANTLAWLCLAAICMIWGTTYTAIKYAVSEFSPFLLASMRQTTAGLLMLLIARALGKWVPLEWTYIRKQAITGALMIAGGNGFITWGMQYVSSGLSAVIGSLTPVMVVLMSYLWQSKERIHWLMGVGVLVGFGGLSLIFKDGWQDFADPDYRWGIAGCLASCVTWSLGTVMAKGYNDDRVPPVVNAGLQVLSGGLVLGLMSICLDQPMQLGVSWQTWAALGYLTLIGSALAFTLYTFTLKHLDATVSSLYTYINPIVAILLGWLYLGERLTTTEAIGMLITLVGVFLVNRGSALAKRNVMDAKA